MYELRQFRPALYLLLLVGVCGFGVASLSPGIWAVAVVGISLNWWFVHKERFVPLPRIVANIITLLALVYVVWTIFFLGLSIVLAIGQFLVLLQLVKLWEQRGNRDYVQLMVLSLLLMVAAAISTANVIFGALLLIYLLISLYFCLLFHLKTETDAAVALLVLPEDTLDAAAATSESRQLSRSLSRVTAIICVVGIAAAFVVFVAFPRTRGEGLFGSLAVPNTGVSLTGFGDSVSLNSVSRIVQNDQVIGHVTIYHNGQPVGAGQELMLRGDAFGVYNGPEAGRSRKWTWTAPGSPPGPDGGPPIIATNGAYCQLRPPPGGDVWEQRFSIAADSSKVLFGLPGAYGVKMQRPRGLAFDPVNNSIKLDAPDGQSLSYAVWSTNASAIPAATAATQPVFDDGVMTPEPGQPPVDFDPVNAPSQIAPRNGRPRGGWNRGEISMGNGETTLEPRPKPQPGQKFITRYWTGRWGEPYLIYYALTSYIDPVLARYARDPAISGVDSQGRPLATQRTAADGRADPLDARIASNIELYLRTHYRYSLDLTGLPHNPSADPLALFIQRTKPQRGGHCEYFAGAMAVMCQSLGMQARVVVGFKTDEYNSVGGYYVIRASNAHSWVEVLTPQGWRTYDPTSGDDTDAGSARHWYSAFTDLFNYLQYGYANSVITYGSSTRQDIVSDLEAAMTNAGIRGGDRMRGLVGNPAFWNFWTWALAAALFLLIAIIVALIGWYFLEKWKLRRRATRMGIGFLPPDEQFRLVRQLAFYDGLVQMLGRRQIVRPAHLTPLEFSESLLYLPAEAYEQIRRLTRLFYRVRYGRAELDAGQQKRLSELIARLDSELSLQWPSA